MPELTTNSDDLQPSAACFAEVLAEEAIEINELRRKRGGFGWEDPSDKEGPHYKSWEQIKRIKEHAGMCKPGEEKPGENAANEAIAAVERARKMELVGLAFSGGGIRSATFNLGVLQGLAKYEKLRMFDYLSTVSGGGYIGGWLEAWIYRIGRPSPATPGKDDAASPKEDEAEAMHRGVWGSDFHLSSLQGLARFTKWGVLDYLSTVSFGVTISGWFEGRKKAGSEPKPSAPPAGEPSNSELGEHSKPREGIDIVSELLRPTRTARDEATKKLETKSGKSHTEPPPIRFLREYSNYLTPQLGALGADTWTVISIYLRNLLLNQLILVLFLFALLLVPYVAVWLTGWLGGVGAFAGGVIPPIAAFVLFCFALGLGAWNLRGLMESDPEKKPARFTPYLPPQEQKWVVITIVLPVFLALWIVTAWIWPHVGDWDVAPFYKWGIAGVILSGIPLLVASQVTAWQDRGGDFLVRRIWWAIWWAGLSLLAGWLGGSLMWLVAHEAFAQMKRLPGAHWHELALGVPLSVVVFLAACTLHIGLLGERFGDPYREWWARVAGWILIVTIMWTGGFALVAYAPLGLVWVNDWLKTAGVVTWIGSTLAGVLGANSGKTSGEEPSTLKNKLLSITPYVFIAGLVSLLSLALELLLARAYLTSHNLQGDWEAFVGRSPAVGNAVDWVLQLSGNISLGGISLNGQTISSPAASATPKFVGAHFNLLDSVSTGSPQIFFSWELVLLCGLLVLICIALSYCVDLNEFSMNLMYRNRLTRCYLGASHEDRDPNPFSGFDSQDDVFLSKLRAANSYSGPLPIVNTTLNLVNTRELAWQERKAASFMMTPLRCGFDTWLEQVNLDKNYKLDRKMGHATDIAKYAYRPTEKYAYEDDGFYLGTAVSISGAAASPNMGYHSSPPLALLMTFFNVRLGFWAGNPRSNDKWLKPGPRVGLWQLLVELFGWTDDNADYVYLSDGGHFENLGLYELVKRRCKYIVVCDAGADPTYTLDDLGGAIRKCREDVGVEIEIDTSMVVPNAGASNLEEIAGKAAGRNLGQRWTERHFAIGKIHYNTADPEGEEGILVYIKASLTGDEPADVLNYQTGHTSFPHETTADQWFTESQFESYRRLGQHVVEVLLGGPVKEVKGRYDSKKDATSAGELFEQLELRWSVPKG